MKDNGRSEAKNWADGDACPEGNRERIARRFFKLMQSRSPFTKTPQPRASFILHPFFVVLLLLPLVASAERDPRDASDLTAEQRTITNWQQVSETWFPWPFIRVRHAPDHAQVAVFPFVSITHDDKLQRKNVDVLWPLSSWRRREAGKWGVEDRTDFTIFPLYYSGGGERQGVAYHHRFLIPFYWQGRQDDGGKYLIIFPFVWHARDARLVVPLFPPRKQNFSALWPVAGEFHDYWNRDGFQFFLWPIFVKSWKGQGEDRVELLSFVWPITGYYRGEKVKGFRLWPLVSYVDVKDEKRRAYWLFPLGRYSLSRGTGVDGADEKIVLFFPFYGRMRTRNINYDAVFPFYGKLQMAGRRSRGWALATYMEDDNLRTGIRTHRILWFLIRWTSRIEVPTQFADRAAQANPMEGGGVFPLYIHRHNEKRDRMTVLWPFYHRRVDMMDDYQSRRSFLVPFWAMNRQENTDGTSSSRGFLWPFYRHWRDADGNRYQSAPHLFPYSRIEAADRNWAPFWTVWSRRWNEQTNESRTRFLGGVWKHDRNIAGDERRRLDLLLFSTEKRRPADSAPESDTNLLFGALGLHRREGRLSLSLFGAGRPAD
jgi:hypothetical protein